MTDALAWGMAATVPSALRILWDIRWTRAWKRRPRGTQATKPEDKSTSLLLCAHNDLDHLKAIWPLWRRQNFPSDWDIEWVVVNDGSTDGTKQWLDKQCADDPHGLTVVHHQKTRSGKKDALSRGITIARHDRLVLTDSDCRPGPDWAFGMATSLGNGPCDRIVSLGFSLPLKGEQLFQFDALRIAWQYGAAAALGEAYMGVGRNLAYRKSHWQALNGFHSHLDLSSGDDDLFVQSAQQKGHLVRTFSTRSPNMNNPTAPSKGRMDGLHRKRRHLSTAPRYTAKTLISLAVDTGLDPLVALLACAGAFGLLHNAGWIPMLSAGLALLFRAVNLSSFAKDLGLPAKHGFRAVLLGPMRWGFLAVATLLNFTSSPTWTQRALTSRS